MITIAASDVEDGMSSPVVPRSHGGVQDAVRVDGTVLDLVDVGVVPDVRARYDAREGHVSRHWRRVAPGGARRWRRPARRPVSRGARAGGAAAACRARPGCAPLPPGPGGPRSAWPAPRTPPHPSARAA